MKNIQYIVMLLAGIISVIFSMLNQDSMNNLAYRLIVVLFIFFVVGNFFQNILLGIKREKENEIKAREEERLEDELRMLEKKE